MVTKTPRYNTLLMNDVYSSSSEFLEDYNETYSLDDVYTLTKGSYIFLLLSSRYGNNPIANESPEFWKMKFCVEVSKYAPIFEKEMTMRANLLALSDDDLMKGSKTIYNRASHPATEPTTSTLDELTYIDEQNTSNYKRSKMEAYQQLLMLLDDSFIEEFIGRFKKLFKNFVSSEDPLLFIEDDDDE